MKLVAWKIYYSDKTFDSSQGKWESAPSTDVQGVILYFDELINDTTPSRQLFKGYDSYAFDGKVLTVSDEYAESNWHNAKLKGDVKTGAWTSDENMARIIEDMDADMGEGLAFKPRLRVVTKDKGDKFDNGKLPKQEKR